MEKEELDELLQVLENPVRRRIVKRLSQGPSYALQLAKELGMGQPLIAKHLVTMEEAGLVSSSTESSERGPYRKTYSLAKSISITLDIAPNLFNQRGFSFDTIKEKELSAEDTRTMAETSRISGDEQGDLSALSDVLTRVDGKLRELEEKRAGLLFIRNKAMQSATKAIDKVEGRAEKRVIHSILEDHDMNVGHLSEALDLREAVIRDILQELHDILE